MAFVVVVMCFRLAGLVVRVAAVVLMVVLAGVWWVVVVVCSGVVVVFSVVVVVVVVVVWCVRGIRAVVVGVLARRGGGRRAWSVDVSVVRAHQRQIATVERLRRG